MDSNKHSADLKDLRKRNRLLGLLNAVQAACLVLALSSIFKMIGHERTILTPPSVMRTFWVSGEKASASYLEQMAGFIAWLVLDVSPASIQWKKDILLGYVDPGQYGAFKTRQDLEADRLKRLNASTVFEPKQFIIQEEQQTVIVHGRLRTYVNTQDLPPEQKAYRIVFDLKGSRLHLKTFQEVSHGH